MKERHAKHGEHRHKTASDEAAEKKEHAPESSDAAREEIAKLKDQLLRLQADFENFRKRTLKEKESLVVQSNADLLGEILPALDHFELGLKTAVEHQTHGSVTDGFRMVYDQLMAALKRHGLSPMDAEGQVFDPNLHEAVVHIPSEDTPADTVVAQTRRGYRLGNTLLRPCQVVVSSGPATPEPPAASPAEQADNQNETGVE